ncbi:MAG: GNAT family N-acetyltransferase [Micromonosporaceae bacterium]
MIRRVVGTRDGRPLFSDLLGELVEYTDSHATVRDASGTDVVVPREQIAAAKPIPPRPARRPARPARPAMPPGPDTPDAPPGSARGPEARPTEPTGEQTEPTAEPTAPTSEQIVALERVAAQGWPAAETDWLGGWLLRASEGWTNRGNAVLPLADPGLPVPDALEQVHRWYAERGLAPRFAVPLPAFAELDRELRRRGWRETHTVEVRTAALPTVPERADLPPVTIEGAPDQEWLRIVAGRKGSLPPVAVRVLTGARRPGFATVYDAGQLIAIGRGVVDEDWLGLSLLEVVPDSRRRGLARQVVGALVRWAAGHGARRAYLQLEEENGAAASLYAGLGFTVHHRYVNRTAP